MRRNAIRIGLLFSVLYFVQGLAEPGEGMIAQPVKSLLIHWKKSPSEIAHFAAIISAPWVIKPLYGLLIDFVPLFGSRRRNYLLLGTSATAVSLLWLAVRMPTYGNTTALLILLIIPTLAVAFSDVVADALMVEKGKPLGMTGRLQSIQWGSMYGATLLAGSLGGWMSEHQQQELGFLVCGLGAAVTTIVTWLWIQDTPVIESANAAGATAGSEGLVDIVLPHEETVGTRLEIMRRTLISRHFLIIAAFLFLWNFNPFSSTIQQLHLTEYLSLTALQYGHSCSLFSVGSIGACLMYGVLNRRISVRWLIHTAIAGGVLSTLAYLLVRGVQSAFVVSVFAGFVYMLGNLIQMDLAARMCPSAIAGSMFAMLMSVANLSIIASTMVGGTLYQALAVRSGGQSAYVTVVLIGAASTGVCWLLVPWFRSHSEHK